MHSRIEISLNQHHVAALQNAIEARTKTIVKLCEALEREGRKDETRHWTEHMAALSDVVVMMHPQKN